MLIPNRKKSPASMRAYLDKIVAKEKINAILLNAGKLLSIVQNVSKVNVYQFAKIT